MNFITKYNVGDKVFVLENNLIVCDKIEGICVTHGKIAIRGSKHRLSFEKNDCKIYYRLEKKFNKYESDLFKTKEDLIKSL